MFPNTFSALVCCPAPRARETTEPPPIPTARPSAAIKKVIGITTVRAEIARGPIQRPTKIVSTIMFNDMTKIPIEAGTACFISRLLIDLVPNESEFFFNVVIATTELQNLLGCLITLPLHYPVG